MLAMAGELLPRSRAGSPTRLYLRPWWGCLRLRKSAQVYPRQNERRPQRGYGSPNHRQAAPAGVTPPAPKLPVFAVSDIRPVGTGSLVGFFTVRIGKEPTRITVHGWRLLRQKDQEVISAPQESWEDGDGRRKYRNLFEYPKSWRPALTDAVLAAWREHERHQVPEQRP